jgi:hypothetical protein
VLIWILMVRPLLGEEEYTSPPRWLMTAGFIAVQEEGERSIKLRPLLGEEEYTSPPRWLMTAGRIAVQEPDRTISVRCSGQHNRIVLALPERDL